MTTTPWWQTLQHDMKNEVARAKWTRSLSVDSQRGRVYIAESIAVQRGVPVARVDNPMAAWWRQEFPTAGSVTDWVRDLESTDWFQERWGWLLTRHGIGEIAVRTLASRCPSLGQGLTGQIAFHYPVPLWVIVHELAHATTPRWARHHPIFARCYLEWLERVGGRPERRRWTDLFRKYRVRFCARKDLTPLQRARQRARCQRTLLMAARRA